MAAPTQPAPAGEPGAASRLDRIGAFLDRADRAGHKLLPVMAGAPGACGVAVGIVAGEWLKAGVMALVTCGCVWLLMTVERWLRGRGWLS